MESGTGLTAFAKMYPRRFFDVGIAEGHAAAMSAGLAKQGLTPVFAVYSSFLQRAYDMLIHDVSLQNLHVVLAVDRAGLVGHDGETHNGVFDVSFLSSVPHMTVYAPASFAELGDMLRLALHRVAGPVALRYPRGGEGEYLESRAYEPVSVLRRGEALTLVSYGVMINEALTAVRLLERSGISAELIKLNRIHPPDTDAVLSSLKKTRRLLVAEDVCRAGSIGSRLLAAAAEQGLSLESALLLDLGDGIVPQGGVQELLSRCGLDGPGIAAAALSLFPEMVSNA
jgi:1-deoxy-D-xylulose-5-phosphate synthase